MYTKGSYKREERQGVHKETCEVLHKGCSNPSHGDRPRCIHLASSPAKNDEECYVRLEPTIRSHLR